MPVWPIFWDAMTNACDQLHIEVVNDEVIVTLPLTSYNVTYYRPEIARYVLATKFTDRPAATVPLPALWLGLGMRHGEEE